MIFTRQPLLSDSYKSIAHYTIPHNFNSYTRPLSCAHHQKYMACMRWVGTVDRCGYGGQQKDSICDVREGCPSIWTPLNPVFAKFDWFVGLTSCLDAYIWRYGDLCERWWWQRWYDQLLYLLHMRAGYLYSVHVDSLIALNCVTSCYHGRDKYSKLTRASWL